MSEVKNPILGYADSYRTMARKSPANRQQVSIWSVVADLERNMAPLWDAQRLRADTAEADSNRKDGVIEDLIQSNSDMTTCLAAAEQRIAEMIEFIRDAADSAQSAGMLKAFINQLDAAPNPNPEAESHGS